MQQILDFENARFQVLERPEMEKASELRRLRGSEELEFALAVLDAYKIKISHVYDKLSSLSNSRTRLLPHQIEATYLVANALRPRFILADEVGLGKTVEAGLIMKELSFRRGFKRVLVVTPAPLSVQWQQEMKSKFNDEFEILKRSNFYKLAANWAAHPRLLTSIDFIKNPKYGDEILKRKWDIVVFDEAHRLRRDYNKVTHAYAFADKIAERCEAMLLLTATPFRGKLEELYFLVRLVDPNLLGPFHSFTQEYLIGDKSNTSLAGLKDKISRVLLRRRKVEVGGFTKRFAMTIRLELTELERLFYDETTDYVKREYNLAMQEKNRAVGFIMIVFQKLLDSSTRALITALERRKVKLEQNLYAPALKLAGAYDDFDWDELNDDEELEDRVSEDPTFEPRRKLRDLRREILTLNRLIKIGRGIPEDKKLQKLRETMLMLRKEGYAKFIIFTQFRTTQDYLKEHLEDEFRITPFHGSLNMQQKEDAVEEFRRETEVFICTEAGGEGRNLQFASVLFNYDLPWSPLKIEQRIGRIHRFGQKVDVKIFNFSTADTVAERVLEVLEEKIRLFEESIGPSDALLGAVEEGHNFEKSLMDFASGRKTRAELNAELESSIEIAKAGYSRLNELVTPQCIDFNLNDYYEFSRESRAIENNAIECLTLSYLRLNEDPVRLEKIAAKAGAKTGSKNAKRKSGDGSGAGSGADYMLHDEKGSRTATFRSEIALTGDANEFLAAGHPLVERALEFFLEHPDRRTFQVLPRGKAQPGWCFVYLCHFVNGLSRSELMTCLVPETGPDAGKATIPEEDVFPPGLRPGDFKSREIAAASAQETDAARMDRANKIALAELRRDANARAVKLREELHSIFKKEEYKLEISYGKKMRQLRERLDIQKMRHRMKATSSTQAAVTRTENELAKAGHEKDRELARIRKDGRIETKLELLQVYYLA